ncbi:hypothetical protein PVAP13_8NG246800 [Panicum virgatum]|uniref:Uncharacterized protein n=1 Tax=Panicum virgatum TaxID=38727 RepID=A0A8T0P692_PANVG|nr:hypothetical protein PVAP13_8NG246800 [Panicum virgatum]
MPRRHGSVWFQPGEPCRLLVPGCQQTEGGEKLIRLEEMEYRRLAASQACFNLSFCNDLFLMSFWAARAWAD